MENIRQDLRFQREIKLIVAPVAAALLLSAAGCSKHAVAKQDSFPADAITLDMSNQTEGIEDTDSLSIDLEDIGIADYVAGQQPKADQYVNSEHARLGSHGVLATIEPKEDKIVLIDQSPDGMSDSVKEWFQNSVENNGVLIKTAFKTGSLKKIIVGIENDYDEMQDKPNGDAEQALVNGFFEDKTDTAVINFTSNNPEDLDQAATQQLILHEVIHSFFKNSPISTFNPGKVAQSTMNRFMGACKNLRSEAIDVFNENSWQFASSVHTLAALQEDPMMRERFNKVAYNFAGGVAVDANYTYAISEIEELNECYFPSLGQIGLETARTHGIPEPGEYTPTDDFMDTYYTVQDELYNSLREDSPYNVLMESKYLNGQYDNMGHSYDGVDELAASTTNILLSFPDQLASSISGLPEDQKQAIIDVVRTVIDELVRTNPDIADILHDREASLMEALRAS